MTTQVLNETALISQLKGMYDDGYYIEDLEKFIDEFFLWDEDVCQVFVIADIDNIEPVSNSVLCQIIELV